MLNGAVGAAARNPKWQGMGETMAVVWWLLSGAWFSFILAETWTPRPLVPAPHATDWLLHGAGFAVLGVLLRLAVTATRPGASLLRTAGLGAGLGALNELGQIPVPGRSASITDLLADIVGVLIGAAAIGLAWHLGRGR